MDLDILVKEALREDCPTDDITTLSLEPLERTGKARLKAKEDLILSGSNLFAKTIKAVSPLSNLQWNFHDGDFIYKDQIVATISGDLVSLLRAERVALNFLGHLSGIASFTHCFVKEVKNTDCKILDTRKTTPGYRYLEKQAVLNGGGHNHRFHLSESILIKENHIYLTGGCVQRAIEQVRRRGFSAIEVEVISSSMAKTSIDAGATRLLLDNMSNEEMAACIAICPSEIETEASGNMGLERVRSVAELGVNYISVGALTHSPPCADFSLLFYGEQSQ